MYNRLLDLQKAVRFTLLVMLSVLPAGAQESLLREASRLDSEQKCDEAEHLYQKALSQGPISIALLNNTGNHYLVCGTPEKAEPYFQRIVKSNPQHGNANLQLARMATGRHQGAQALSYLARVGGSQPESGCSAPKLLIGPESRPKRWRWSTLSPRT